MKSFINIKNKIFGNYKVIKFERKAKRGWYYWLCQCRCKREKPIIVSYSKLISGTKKYCKSCQYENVGKALKKDLTGKIFGKLVVIREGDRKIQPSGRKAIRWLCRCSCGRSDDFLVYSEHLNYGSTVSCKKCRYEVISEKNAADLKNKVFGKLKVIKRNKNFKNVTWLCQCQCGEKVSVKAMYLSNGSVKSCGCLNESIIAFEVKKYFSKNNGSKKEYKIFKNPETNRWLPFDVYIPHGKNPDLNGFYIEIHGKQHYQNDNHFFKNKEEFEKRKSLDKLKKKFAKKNGKYIEVDLRKIKNTQEAIKLIKEKMGEIYG